MSEKKREIKSKIEWDKRKEKAMGQMEELRGIHCGHFTMHSNSVEKTDESCASYSRLHCKLAQSVHMEVVLIKERKL